MLKLLTIYRAVIIRCIDYCTFKTQGSNNQSGWSATSRRRGSGTNAAIHGASNSVLDSVPENPKENIANCDGPNSEEVSLLQLNENFTIVKSGDTDIIFKAQPLISRCTCKQQSDMNVQTSVFNNSTPTSGLESLDAPVPIRPPSTSSGLGSKNGAPTRYSHPSQRSNLTSTHNFERESSTTIPKTSTIPTSSASRIAVAPSDSIQNSSHTPIGIAVTRKRNSSIISTCASARISRVSTTTLTTGSVWSGDSGFENNPASQLLISMLVGDLINCANFLAVHLLNILALTEAPRDSVDKVLQYIKYLREKKWAQTNNLTTFLYQFTTSIPQLSNAVSRSHLNKYSATINGTFKLGNEERKTIDVYLNSTIFDNYTFFSNISDVPLLDEDVDIERDLLADEPEAVRCTQVVLRGLRMSSHAFSLLCLGALIADLFLAITQPTRHRHWISSRVVSALLVALVGLSLMVCKRLIFLQLNYNLNL